jgi:two-component system CheB/CheR fusion protein
MVTDIGHRKRAEQSAALLAGIGEILSIGGSIDQSARAVTRRLVSQLGLSRCLLAEIENDDTVNVFHHESVEPEPAQLGAYRIADFLTPEERAKLASGLPLVINDVREGRDTAAAARFRALGIGAVVSAPYVSDGRRKFTLAVEKREPYAWQPYEVELLREVSARMYLQFDRARSEQTLRESERRYRSLVSVITDIPCTVDPEGRFVTLQDAWSRYTGQTWEHYRGFGWLDAVHPDDRRSAREKWTEACRSRSLYEVRARIWHAETREFRCIVARATPVLDDHGVLREWVGACTDIHDETRQAEALIEADRRKDEFLATLAHELRNPLAPIRNSLHILKLTGKAEGAVAGVYQMLDRQVKHLVRLVDDLMEVSRITRGRIELRMERTDLASVLQSAVETSRPLIDEAGHRLEVSLPPEPLHLDADSVRLAQVVANLLNNAAKYTDRGGHIRVRARREGSSAVISVRDNGRGIAADVLPKVFDLFTQSNGNLDRSRGGLGIGLTLVRQLVELHGGTVEAHSDGIGHGSEFIVRLPAAADMRPTHAGTLRAAPDVACRRILVVDDNRDAAESLGMLLALLGMETRTAHGSVAALDALDEFRPSVMLLDIGMPGMDGLELARRMRQHPFGRNVTLVALTGWGQERDRRRTRDAGIDHHLVKPVDLDALRSLLANLPRPAEQSVQIA